MAANNDPALPGGSLSQTCQLQIQDEKFSFTPVKAVGAPRVWDRKPSNAFLARSKSRKVWKRFRSSFNSMKAIQRLVVGSYEDAEEDLFAEINVSRGLGFVRGVKRQCFGLESSDKKLDVAATRGRSFLETKWESEATGRRRKLPANHSDLMEIPAVSMDVNEESEDDGRHGADNQESRDAATSTTENTHDADASFDSTRDTSMELALSPAYPRILHGVSSCRDDLTKDDCNSDLKPADNAQTCFEMGSGEPNVEIATAIAASITAADDQQSGPSVENTGSASASAPVEDLSAEQESTLVRSALCSSLDGDDAELFTNFLSKAQAARAAKAAAMTVQPKETTPEPIHQEVTEMPTPPSRRVLEELDANSPSPSKPQLSPVKAVAKGSSPVDAASKKEASGSENENLPTGSPIRRSARNRAPKLAPRINTPTLRTLSLRRAKGTEFVFLQRTEAQELALTTRRNTRQNRGDAVMPKYVLQALGQKQQKASVSDGKSVRDAGPKRMPGKKYVTWNEERLVEYEGDSKINKDNKKDGKSKSNDVAAAVPKATVKSTDQKSASSRSTRSQSCAKTGDDNPVAALTTAVAPATPTGRRVRRLGTSKPNSIPAAATSTTTASLLPAPSSTGSAGEVGKRKKLIPKPPSVVVTGTPVSKKTLPRASSSSSSSGGGGGGNNSSDKSSDDSTSGRLLGIKSKNILKAHAGSTPMPRRIRSRS